jgi:hypothetical protein
MNQELPEKNHPTALFHNTVCRFNVATVDANHYDALRLTLGMSGNGDFDSFSAEISQAYLNLTTSY